MPEYVYPISEQGLKEEKNLNTISLDNLVDKIAHVVDNGDGTKMPSWLKQAFASNQAQEILAETDDNEFVRTASTEKRAKRTLPEALKEHMFHKKEDEGKDKSDDDDDTDDDTEEKFELKEGKKSSVRQRRIHFAHSSQLSAEAVTAAKDAGDEELANTILAARHERRVRTAQRIIHQATEHAETQKKLAQRANYRMTVVASANTPATKVAAAPKKQVKVAAKTAAAKVASAGDGFKDVSALSRNEKSVLAERYVASGFPVSYVNQLLGINQPVAELPEEFKVALREVGASAISDTVKRTVLSSMIREANLTEEQRKRGEDYWTKDLGYVKDWSSDLWSKAYDDDGSDDGATV